MERVWQAGQAGAGLGYTRQALCGHLSLDPQHKPRSRKHRGLGRPGAPEPQGSRGCRGQKDSSSCNTAPPPTRRTRPHLQLGTRQHGGLRGVRHCEVQMRPLLDQAVVTAQLPDLRASPHTTRAGVACGEGKACHRPVQALPPVPPVCALHRALLLRGPSCSTPQRH